MHYSVPQFIEVEDKIIGPLTMKQFLWLLLGGGMIFILNFMLRFGIWLVVSIFIGAIMAALAFIKVYNMPLISFIGNFIRFSLMPQIFLWKTKDEGPIQDFNSKMVFDEAVQAPPPQKPQPYQGRLRALSWRLDIKGGEEDNNPSAPTA